MRLTLCALRSPLPAEKAVRIVPFFGFIEVEAVEPAFFVRADLAVEAVGERRLQVNVHVAKQPRKRERTAPERAFETLLIGRKLPRCHAADHGATLIGNGEDTVADGDTLVRNQREILRVTIVNIRRADAAQGRIHAERLEICGDVFAVLDGEFWKRKFHFLLIQSDQDSAFCS